MIVIDAEIVCWLFVWTFLSTEWQQMCVCVCVRIERTWSMHNVSISTYQFIPYYASATRKHTHTRILKPFEDSEPTGLKVDIACSSWHVCEMGGFTRALLRVRASLKVDSHLQGDHSEEWSQGPSHLWHGPKHTSAASAIRTATSAKPQNQRQHQFWDRWWVRRADVWLWAQFWHRRCRRSAGLAELPGHGKETEERKEGKWRDL